MSMTHETDFLKCENLDLQVADLLAFAQASLQEGSAAHQVELGIWYRALGIGRTAFGRFLDAHGTGDMGETITLPTGQQCQRLEELHDRRYVSIFGEFKLRRVVYGNREGQKIDFVPLDNRLQLPASAFSYVLQDWDQTLCVEQAFAQVNATIARMLNFKQTVDSLEHMNQEVAQSVPRFMDNPPALPVDTEGEIFVTSADGKGIVMRRAAGDEAPPTHRTKGEKASKKRMAIVGIAYTVDRYVRTAKDVLEALFRDKREKAANRPRPQHKRVRASLPRDDVPGSGTKVVFEWLLNEVGERDPGLHKEMVFISDGQESLWEARDQYLPQRNCVGILDLLHVTPRIWKAAHIFHPEGSNAAEQFVRAQVLRVLQGKAAGVVCGLREKATKLGVSGAKKRTLDKICRYLKENLHRMRYDEYLAAGYPIASGAVEGACRHLINDRMERAGMHWTIAGAQAMLDVRSMYISGQWEEFQAFRIKRETRQMYPYREMVVGKASWLQDGEPQHSMAC